MLTINHVKWVDIIESTNSYLKSHYKRLKCGFLLCASAQTGGRGQRENVWKTEPGKNLTFSFYLTSSELDKYQIYRAAVLAIIKVLEDHHISADVKMPNDIYVKKEKIAGILIESIHDDTVQQLIVGVGINVNQIFTSEKLNATSMAKLKGKTFDLKHVLDQFVRHFNTLVQMLNTHDLLLENIRFECHRVHYQDHTYQPIKLDSGFNLLIKNATESFWVSAEKVSFDYQPD